MDKVRRLNVTGVFMLPTSRGLHVSNWSVKVHGYLLILSWQKKGKPGVQLSR